MRGKAGAGGRLQRLGLGRADHKGLQPLAPFGIGHADHRHVAHTRHIRQHQLDFARIDIEPTGDDHVLLAVDDGDEAVGVAGSHITHGHPAVDDCLCGRGRRVPVSREGIGAPHEELTRRAGCDFGAGVVPQRNLDQREGSSDRTGLGAQLVGPDVGDDAGFGGAICFVQQAGAVTADHHLLQRLGERRGIGDDRFQGCTGPQPRRWQRRQPRELGGDEERTRKVRQRQPVGNPFRIAGFQNDRCAAEEQRRYAEHEAGAVRHGGEDQKPVAATKAAIFGGHRHEGERPAAMGQHHPLGRAGGARRVGKPEGVDFAKQGVGRWGRCVAGSEHKVRPAASKVDEVDPGCSGRRCGRAVGVTQYQPRCAVCQYAG